MRLNKPLIFTFSLLFIILLIISINAFYRLSVIQFALSIGMNISDFHGLVQTNFRIVYILLTIICGIGVVSLMFFILRELTKKLNVFNLKNKTKSFGNNIDSSDQENKKPNEEKDKQTQYIQVNSDNLLNGINEILLRKDEINVIAKKILIEFADLYQIVQGEIYLFKDNKLKLLVTYAYFVPEGKIMEFEIGDGLIGQVAKEMKPLSLDNIPENYITVATGLGKANTSNLIIFPLIFEKTLIGIIELASFKKFSKDDVIICMKTSEILGKYFNMSYSQKPQENNES